MINIDVLVDCPAVVGSITGYPGYNYYPSGSPGGGGDRSYYGEYPRQESPLGRQENRKLVIRHDMYQPEDRLKTYVTGKRHVGLFSEILLASVCVLFCFFYFYRCMFCVVRKFWKSI